MKIELKYPNKIPIDEIIKNIPEINIEIKEIVSVKEDLFAKVKSNSWKNKLVYGDNLPILKYLLKDQDTKGKVNLVYIDPPFSTNRKFRETASDKVDKEVAYNDNLQGYEYIEFIRKRLILLKELLSENGSIYVHQDYRMAPYIKIIMDEIFGEKRFINWITRQKCNPKGQTKKMYGRISDYILFYSKNNKYVWNRPSLKWTEERIIKSEYRYVEEETKRIFKKVPIFGPGIRYGETGKPWKNMMPPEGKHWLWPPSVLDELDSRGEIYWSPTGNPRKKMYLDPKKGPLVQDIWLDVKDPTNQFTAKTDYPTEKSEALLERVIKTASKQGDIVLDCFCGSGTTLAVAEKLNRKWIGIDNSNIAIDTVINRLKTDPEISNTLKPFEYCVIQDL